MDIPGFYYDKEKKKYFRLLSGNRKYDGSAVVLKKYSNTSEPKPYKKNEIQNVVSALNYGQLITNKEVRIRFNNGSLLTLDETINKSRLRELRIRKSIMLPELLNYYGRFGKFSSCSHLVSDPSEDVIYAVWEDPKSGSVVQMIDVSKIFKESYGNFRNHYLASIKLVSPRGRVQHIEALNVKNEDYNALACLTVQTKNNLGSVSSITIYHTRKFNSTDREQDFSHHNISFEIDGIHLCCSTHSKHKFAVGGESKVLIFNFAEDTHLFEKSYFFGMDYEHVTSLKFDVEGNIIYTGTVRGKLHLIDLRAKKASSSYSLDCKTVVDLQMMDDNKMIVSAHENDLFTLDLRYLRQKPNDTQLNKLYTFENHVNKCKKALISTDFTQNTICCSGQDNIIRVWSATSGKQLRQFSYNESKKWLKKTNKTFSYSLGILNQDHTINKHWYEQRSKFNERMKQTEEIENDPCIYNQMYMSSYSSKWRCLAQCPTPVLFGAADRFIHVYF